MEILIIRNSDVRSLFDVVRVDFFAEKAEYIERQLSFEQAQEVKSEYDSRNQLTQDSE